MNAERAAAREAKLAVTKRQATLFLAAASVGFLAVTVWGGDATWVGYVKAGFEASMVGGLADWFAVTALFRHPLGLPIPHTAIVVERKEQFAETLGEFIQESFLTPDVVIARLRASGVVERLAAWLADPANAARLVGEVAGAGLAAAEIASREEGAGRHIQHILEDVARDRVRSADIAPLLGKALHFATESGRHDEVLDAALRGLDRYLDEHRHELRKRLREQAPWWLPGAMEDRLFERLLDGARKVLRGMVGDPDHGLRRDLGARIERLAFDLETSPAVAARFAELRDELIDEPHLREWIGALRHELGNHLRVQAADPGSDLRNRAADAVAALGRRLQEDPDLAATVQDTVERGVAYVVGRFDGEIADLVSGTIDRWDSAETSHRLELLLGPDLQYIRINGTIVGALAGLALHGISQLLS